MNRIQISICCWFHCLLKSAKEEDTSDAVVGHHSHMETVRVIKEECWPLPTGCMANGQLLIL